jgi:hypothetical protein
MVRHAKQSRLAHPLLHPPHRSQVKPPSARGFLEVPICQQSGKKSKGFGSDT